jgi:hypothetical protein
LKPLPSRKKGTFSAAEVTYLIKDGCLHRDLGIRLDQQGQVVGALTKRIANFNAEIIAERVRDDGVEETREFRLRVTRGDEAREFSVPGREFNATESRRWLPERAGARFIVEVQQDSHFIKAVQYLSSNIMQRVYMHTGWRFINGVWRFLHRGLDDVELDLPERLTPFVLPPPPTGEECSRAVRASADLLREGMGPDRIMMPLVAYIYYSPLGLRNDFAFALVGKTGGLKTSLTALAQQHFGAGWSEQRLPDNWVQSTLNHIEYTAFSIKDAIAVIDDFKPSGTPMQRADLNRKLDYIVRGAAGGTSRGRMTHDLKPRPDRAPRCALLMSAEERAIGESLTGRMLQVPVALGDVVKHKLKVAQEAGATGLYAAAMAAYLDRLAPELTAVRAEAGRKREAYHDRARTEAGDSVMHPRLPGIVADLATGLEFFTSFAHEVGALPDSELRPLLHRGWAAIMAAAGIQASAQLEEDPTAIFLNALREALLGGAAHLAHQETGGEPTFSGINLSRQLGWRKEIYRDKPSWKPASLCAGWVNVVEGQVHVYLNFEVAYSIASRIAGRPLPVEAQTLKQRLLEANLLAQVAPKSSRRPYTVQRVIQGAVHDVIFLRTGALFPPLRDSHDKPIAEHGLQLGGEAFDGNLNGQTDETTEFDEV